jgi:heme oxygenase (biliverdin-IX-beta and delta-forming)
LNPTHKALRAATAEAHERVDAAFAGFDLTDRESYARFLQAHAEVVLPLEAAVPGERLTPDWEERKRGALLGEDLAFLRDTDVASPPAPSPAASDMAWDLPALAGTLYVLEGSRLGGKFLARQVPAGLPRAYLASDQPSEKWRNLLDRIDTILYDEPALQSALTAAHRVFAAFERSAIRWTK